MRRQKRMWNKMDVKDGGVALLLAMILLMSALDTEAETCGPMGYKAAELLGPAYWFFDLNATECLKMPQPKDLDRLMPVNGTGHACRFYMHICNAMRYQCAGTACLRYLFTDDYVTLLGYEIANPFIEGHKSFGSLFTGENGLCKDPSKNVKTYLKFICDPIANWNTTVVHNHGGAMAPKPVSLVFDKVYCTLNAHFNYSGACERSIDGSPAGKSISVGSVLLILFFPGVALYFIIGILINRFAGHHGKELIPHAAFWFSLPDLIMDGFVFTMATITCRHSGDRTSYETM